MSQSGARQWRADCTCCPEVAEQRHTQPWERMHSEISANNHGYFISENRVDTTRWTRDALRRLVSEYDTVLACNVCGAVRVDDGDGFGVVGET